MAMLTRLPVKKGLFMLGDCKLMPNGLARISRKPVAYYAAARKLQTPSQLRNYSILKDFSKHLKGEIEKNPELKSSIEEFKEKAKGLKERTKETAEHLYKHVDAAREEAELKAKQVSISLKEKVSEATDQVKETVGKFQVNKEEVEKKSEEPFPKADTKIRDQAGKQAATETDTSSKQTSSSADGHFIRDVASRVSSILLRVKSSASASLGKFHGGKVADVVKDGYNILVEEITSTRTKKEKPTIPRSSATAVVSVVKKQSGWRKRVEDLKDKANASPMFKRFRTVKEHPVVTKGQEIAEDLRERWETSDSPVVHKIQDLNDSIFGETATAAALREIRSRDPTFSLPEFVQEVQEEIKHVLGAYLKGDLSSLKKWCSREVVDRCHAERRAYESQGIFLDNKILFISEVEVKETKLVGNVPIIILAFQTQQIYCVRDQYGNIREGSKDDIQTVYYAWAMQQVPPEEGDNDFTPRWPIVFQPSGIIKGRCTDEDLPCQEIGLTPLFKHKLWQAAYIHLHFEMASRARGVIESMRMCLQQESVEVADYKKAMVLLRKTEVGVQDVVINLFLPIHSVLVNLLALHYCMLNLNTQVEVAREALIKGKILDRPVCIRWWTFGGWANGFRRQDEMHVKILSLCEIIKPQHQRLFKLMERGTVNEILRIQISADFRNSAWIARDMHSQR